MNRAEGERVDGTSSADGVDTFGDFIGFCRDMYRYNFGKFRDEYFICGSRHDLPFAALTTSDIDIMHVSRKVRVLPAGEIPACLRQLAGDDIQWLTYRTDITHVGYANLETRDDDPLRKSAFQEAYFIRKRGPAISLATECISQYVKCVLEFMTMLDGVSRATADITSGILEGGIEVVRGIFCPYWPAEAAEWVTRWRHFGWPSEALVNRVVGAGCHFVDVAHKLSPNPDVEYRFSFSKAEKTLTDSWTPGQRRMYGVLRLVKRRIDEVRGKGNAMICTYFFKTLMFWSSEEQPEEFWNDNSLVESFVVTLSRLVDWIAGKNCPNYFIPANNMMDHIPDCEELHLEQMIISECIVAAEGLITEYNSLVYNNSAYNDVIVKLPRSVINRIKEFSWWLHDLNGNDYKTADKSGLTEIDNCMIFEFRNLYRGLDFQLRGCSTRSPDEKALCFNIAHNLLLESIRSDDGLQAVNVTNLTLTNFNFKKGLHDLTACSLVNSSYMGATYWRRKPLTSLEFKHDKIIKNENIDTLLNCQTNPTAITRETDTGQFWWKSGLKLFAHFASLCSSDGQENSLPLTIVQQTANTYADKFADPNDGYSWNSAMQIFASTSLSSGGVMMYTANFYYTVRLDYRNAMHLCDRVIDDASMGNHNVVNGVCRFIVDFAVGSFPVLLSPRLMPVFDDEIQTVFGFVVLHKTLRRDRRYRKVSVAVCPTQFAHYIRIRCLIAIGSDWQCVQSAFEQASSERGMSLALRLHRHLTAEDWFLPAVVKCAIDATYGSDVRRRIQNGASFMETFAHTYFGFGEFIVQQVTAKFPNLKQFLSTISPNTD